MEKQTKTNSEVVVFTTMNDDPEEIFFREEEENDLCYWEFINSSDSDADDVFSLSDASWHSSISSSAKDSSIPDLVPDYGGDDHHRHLDSHLFCGGYGEPNICDREEVPDYGGGDHHHDSQLLCDGYGEPYIGDQEEDDGDDYDYDDEEQEQENDGYDLDDELVPRALRGKFGRQRMRKLGKRAFAKMNTSKKSPFLYVKAGCVHGKHGLGLKHSF